MKKFIGVFLGVSLFTGFILFMFFGLPNLHRLFYSEQVIMPEEMLDLRLDEMSVGSEGWINSSYIDVDYNRLVWVCGYATVSKEEEEHGADCHVVRNSHSYFSVSIPSDEKWLPSHVMWMNDVYPVKKVTVMDERD